MLNKSIVYIVIVSIFIFLAAPLVHGKNKSKWTPLFGKKSKKVEGYRSKIEEKEKVPLSPNQKTPYEEYYLTIREQIYDMVRREGHLGIKGEVELQFTLDRSGFITRGPIVLNKPDLRLVRAAVKSVKKVAPFPKFPSSLDKEEAEFYIVVRYK